MIQFINNTVICGDPVDPGSLAQCNECAKHVDYSLLMADHHKGYSVSIGGVLVDKERFAPAAVGYDIACGLKAIKLDIGLKAIKLDIVEIMDEVTRRISFGVGRNNNNRIEHDLFDDPDWALPCFKGLKDIARNQLGTVGAGNHFVDVWIDQYDDVWAGCHFGSRGLGHKTATWFLTQMGAKDDIDSPPAMLHQDSELGELYIRALDLVGAYAYAGRDWVCNEVADIICADVTDEVHQHHNFLWKEEHQGTMYWVGRKGATPAFPGQKSLIGASMCEPCVIVEGRDSHVSEKLFYSTVHGAGRTMSRTACKGKRNRKTGELIIDPLTNLPKNAGCVTQEMMDGMVKEAGIELRGGDVDESPFAYKRINEVLQHHMETITVLNVLTPIGVSMAPKNMFDPYKD